MSLACFSACLAFSAALFSSLALPPFGLFFSCLEEGLGTKPSGFLGGILGEGRENRGEEKERREEKRREEKRREEKRSEEKRREEKRREEKRREEKK